MSCNTRVKQVASFNQLRTIFLNMSDRLSTLTGDYISVSTAAVHC